MEKIKDMIYRQDAIDALDEIESEVADGDGFQYEKWRKHFCEMTSARPDHIADGSKKGDTINRQAAADALMAEFNISWQEFPHPLRWRDELPLFLTKVKRTLVLLSELWHTDITEKQNQSIAGKY